MGKSQAALSENPTVLLNAWDCFLSDSDAMWTD